MLLPEHSAARLNRVNCSGGQRVQHSSGTVCLHCVAEGRGQGAGEGRGGARGTTAQGWKSSTTDTLDEKGRTVCVSVYLAVTVCL